TPRLAYARARTHVSLPTLATSSSNHRAQRSCVEEMARAGRPARSDRIDVTGFTRVTAYTLGGIRPPSRESAPSLRRSVKIGRHPDPPPLTFRRFRSLCGSRRFRFG